MKLRATVATLVASAVLAASLPSFAGNREDAIALFDVGKKAWDAGNYAEACAKYEGAHKLEPSLLGVLLNLAICNEKIGKTATAYTQFKELLFAAKKTNDAERENAGKQRSEALEPKLSYLKIVADTSTKGLVIHRDGEEIPLAMVGSDLPTDPGKHTIEATAPGYSVWQTSVVISGDKDKKTLQIPKLMPAPVSEKGGTPPNKPKRNIGIAAAGLGVAGIGLGAVMGLMAASDVSNAKGDNALCPNSKCTPAGREAIDSANTKALVSTIGFGVGIAAAGVGVFLIATSGGSKPIEKAATHFVPVVGPNGGGASYLGTF
jgi:hypothetical protein